MSFFDRFFSEYDVLNQETALDYLAKLRNGKSRSSVMTYGKFMRSILNFAGLPTQMMKFGETKHQPTYLEEEDLVKLCETPHYLRDKLILRLMGFAGMRRGEVASLRVYDVDLKNREILIRAKASRGSDRVKSKNDRKVFIDSRTLELLEEYLNARRKDVSDYLFDISGRHIARITKAAAREAKVIPKGLNTDRYVEGKNPWEYITPHTLRHSFAIMFLKRGGNIRTLQNILGHTSLEVTQLYLRWIPDVDKEQYFRVVERGSEEE